MEVLLTIKCGALCIPLQLIQHKWFYALQEFFQRLYTRSKGLRDGVCAEYFHLQQSCQPPQPGASLAPCQSAPGEQVGSEGGIAAASKELTAIEEWPDV